MKTEPDFIYRRVFGFLLFILLFAYEVRAQQPSSGELEVYTDFLKSQQTSAKDYIISLFDRYDIVVLCERDHREITQYDLILEILKDDRFATVRNASFEIGTTPNNKALNAFIHDKSLSKEQVGRTALHLQRNSYGAALWEKANYIYYLQGVHEINRNLPADRQIEISGLDIGVDWNTATQADIRMRDSLVSHARDSQLAANFIRIYGRLDSPRKSLVVLNYRHALLKDLFGRKNAGRYIANAYPGKVANVYINSFALDRNAETHKTEIVALQDGKWDAAFLTAGKNNIGFDFEGSPFGNDRLDIIPFKNNYTFSEFFTGFVYYNFFPNLRTVTGIDGFIDDQFAPELMRRYELEQKVYGNELPTISELKNNYNTVIDRIYKENKDEFGKATDMIDKWMK